MREASRRAGCLPPKNWRMLPLAELESLILEISRSAAKQHLPQDAWRQLDRMRERAKKLHAEATP
jgi:hypothetical protein